MACPTCSVCIFSAIVMLVHAIILVLIVFVRVFYNHTRLRSIPGPVFAGVSGLWRGYVQNFAGYRQTLSELHQRHGQVVRIGPNVVSVCDPVAIARIYGVDIDWKKVFSPIRASNP